VVFTGNVEVVFTRGLARILGGEGPGGGGAGGGGFGGEAGILRLFNETFGGQITWLLPLAIIAGIVWLVVRAATPRPQHLALPSPAYREAL
jgi:hypothetical protein